MGWLKGAWKWALTVLLVALAVAVFVYLISKGKNYEAKRALADAVDHWAKRKIDARKIKITELEKDLKKNQPKIDKLTKEIDSIEGDLKKKHEKRDLSAEEIANRWDNINV